MPSYRAIVTGGSRGIGLGIARAILDAGGQVAITGRDRVRLDRAVAEVAAGDRLIAIYADVRDRRAVDAMVADTVSRFGGLDVLVNNAGVGVFANVASMGDEEWRQVIDTNLTGAFYCARAAIPELTKSGGGWIVNIASLAARNYFPGGGAYCASKAGLLALSEALMQEVRYDNIRVSCIMPGSVSTEFNHGTPGVGDAWKLQPDDVAEVVMDLLRHPSRSLPSRVEMRPAKPQKRA